MDGYRPGGSLTVCISIPNLDFESGMSVCHPMSVWLELDAHELGRYIADVNPPGTTCEPRRLENSYALLSVTIREREMASTSYTSR